MNNFLNFRQRLCGRNEGRLNQEQKLVLNEFCRFVVGKGDVSLYSMWLEQENCSGGQFYLTLLSF